MTYSCEEGQDFISELQDLICSTLRGTVQDEFSAIRRDLRIILRDELAQTQASSGDNGDIYCPEGRLATAWDEEDVCRRNTDKSAGGVCPRRSASGFGIFEKFPKTRMSFFKAAEKVQLLRHSAVVEDVVTELGPTYPESLRVRRDAVPRSSGHRQDAPAVPPADLPSVLSHFSDVGSGLNFSEAGKETDLVDHHLLGCSPDSKNLSEDKVEDPKTNRQCLTPMKLIGSLRRASTMPADDLKAAKSARKSELERRTRLEMESERQMGAYLQICKFVSESTYFDSCFGVMVIINSAILGIQVDWMARNGSNNPPYVFRVFEIIFCLIFAIEWLLRLVAHGRRFFSRQLWHWHVFDTFLVGSQLFEEIANCSVQGTATFEDNGEGGNLESPGGGNFKRLRVLRFLRLVRIMRTVRVLRLVGELRTLVLSIVGSLRALAWALLLLFLFMYVVGTFVTQVVLEDRLDLTTDTSARDPSVNRDLLFFYGSLGDTILSIYRAITGGIDWGDLLAPLRLVSPYFVPFFMLYIAFATLCMMNVITGVFVESAVASSKQDSTTYLIERLRNLFEGTDADGDGRLSSIEFLLAADTPEIQSVFTHLDLPNHHQEMIFQALDTRAGGSGFLSVEEFVNGCQAMSGPAKCYDLKLMQQERDRSDHKMIVWQQKLESELRRLVKMLDGLASSAAAGLTSAAPRRPPRSAAGLRGASRLPNSTQAWSDVDEV